ncbi:MAG: hypothetical protein WAO02_13890 [Verrucomicrobiia bacterium]
MISSGARASGSSGVAGKIPVKHWSPRWITDDKSDELQIRQAVMARYIQTTFWVNMIAIASVKTPAAEGKPFANGNDRTKYALARLSMER